MEVYVSIDVEADGPIPGPNSMLSLGAAAFLADGTEVSSFEINLRPLVGATPNPDTMAWWRKPRQKEAWEYCQRNQRDPKIAMSLFDEWVGVLAHEADVKPVCVAFPAGYDFMWVYWYMMRFHGRSPFSHSCVDTKTLAMILMGGERYRGASKRNWPKRWFKGCGKHTHKAIDDAREQGIQFCNMLAESKTRLADYTQ